MQICAITLFVVLAISANPTSAKPRDSYCDECVFYNFERDFTVLFSTTEVCTGLQLWTEGSYSNIDVTPPNEYSQGFISPQVNLSCAVSFPFRMSGGGTVNVRVYMDTTDTTLLDQIYVLAEQRTESGNNPTMGIGVLSSTDQDFKSGWQTLTFTLFGSTVFDGHLIFFGLNTARSIVLVDAFCYKPANYDGECWVHDFLVTTTAQPETTVTEVDTTTAAVTYPTTVTEIESTTSAVTEPASTETESTSVTGIEFTTSAVTEATSVTEIDSTTLAETDPTSVTEIEYTTSAATDTTSVTGIEYTTSEITEPTSVTESDLTTSAATEPTTITESESTTPVLTETTTVTEIESTTPVVTEPTTITVIESTTSAATEPEIDYTTSVVTEPTSVTDDGSSTSAVTESPSATESTSDSTNVTTEPELPLTTTSSPSTTASPPTLPVPTCSADECSWLISYENNCNLFYQCIWGQKVLRQCPIGLHFNYLLQVCDFPINAGCIFA